MFQVVVNVLRWLYGLVYSLFRPLRRLCCKRRKSDESDGSELTSIGTGDLKLDSPVYGQVETNSDEVEMESWDAWNDPPLAAPSNQSQSQMYPDVVQGAGHANHVTNGATGRPGVNNSAVHNYYYNQKLAQPEPEPEPDFFGDMTPNVKKQKKILIRKQEKAPESSQTSLLSKMAVMSDIPAPGSELSEWQEEGNAWDTEEAAEDLTWQAEEAIKEKRRKERMERQLEQQRKKQKKEEMRGMKTNSSLLATKLS